jgi:hypothetical protein
MTRRYLGTAGWELEKEVKSGGREGGVVAVRLLGQVGQMWERKSERWQRPRNLRSVGRLWILS